MGQTLVDTSKRAAIKNPQRVPGQWIESEKEVERIAHGHIQQKKKLLITKTYEYEAPFNYPNVKVELGRENVGAEINDMGIELDIPPFGAITIEEEEPIVAVTVIGSACTAPGYVILHAEPVNWHFPRSGVKMKADNLWGEHVFGPMWHKGVDESDSHAGMSSAHFEIPESKKITVMGGSQADVKLEEADPKKAIFDGHYAFRIIRVTVLAKDE